LPAGIPLHKWLSKLQNVCCFHIAILIYNLGRYEEARSWFQSALTHDPLDYQSLTYIPEVMFLGGLSAFDKIRSEFEAAMKTVGTLSPDQEKSFSQSGKRLISLLYLKLGNCFLAKSPFEEFQKRHDLTRAEDNMRRAFEQDPSSTIAKFSLAQVLYERGKDRARYLTLFNEVFGEIRGAVAQITEAKILMMNYYILAICCALGEVPNEMPSLYTMRIYELVPNLPNPGELRIFSPRTKNDLRVPDFIKEVQEFENKFRSSSGGRVPQTRSYVAKSGATVG
jgi:tetratricopeptide (TPR) repeat protein